MVLFVDKIWMMMVMVVLVIIRQIRQSYSDNDDDYYLDYYSVVRQRTNE